MTFDEWMLTIAPAHKPSDDGVKLRILRACWKASEAAARERCAQICEQAASGVPDNDPDKDTLLWAADMIRDPKA